MHGVDRASGCSISVLMGIETLGDAWQQGWLVSARCAAGWRDGMKSVRNCTFSYKLAVMTLLMTRGPNFPLTNLQGRLMCPRCGSRDVRVIFDVPKTPDRRVAGQWPLDNVVPIGRVVGIAIIVGAAFNRLAG